METTGLQIRENTTFESFWKITNPDYRGEKYRVFKDLYEGGARIELIGGDEENKKEILKEYLPRHPFESSLQYNIRLKRACYRNFCRPVVNVFNSSIWRKTPTGREELPENVGEYRNDVDNKGTSADDFFRNATQAGAATGIAYVLVDSTHSDLVDFPTIAAVKENGVRPFFSIVPGESLVDWGFDKDGRLDWIKIREEIEKPRDSIFDETDKTRRIRVWTKTEWVIYEEQENKDIAIARDVNGRDLYGVHDLGIVPIVPFYFDQKKRMVGDPVHVDIVSLALKLFRKDSELDKLEFDCAVPFLFGRGISEEAIANFVRASSNALTVDEPSADIRYVEPSGVSFTTLSNSIGDIENSIREISLRMIRKQTGAAEAAEAKKLDRTQLETQLAVFADRSAAAEWQCWKLMSYWLGTPIDKVDESPIKYNKDFDPFLMETQYMASVMELVLSKVISRKTARTILKSGEFLPESFDPEEEDRLIEEEKKTEGPMAEGWADGKPPRQMSNKRRNNR